MTIKELAEILESYPEEAHVVVTLVPKETLIVQTTGCKLDIRDGWRDRQGVVNIIATTEAGVIDPELRTENDI